MCVVRHDSPIPECITFRTIRLALAECDDSTATRRGFMNEEARLAYVVARLRAANDSDCLKAADFLMRIVRPL